ncbi:hypothetical protein [Streptomyces sp. SLBN-8D4]|uniref:hypothetical protein n=1 Tax=Streptomyces sp. SLBN-8D4 TaxID=3377728 RepID=UPI003C7E2065
MALFSCSACRRRVSPDLRLDRLGAEPRGHRLYVLEVGGRYPRVKVGASENVWRRLKEHIAEMNLWQHGLLDAHVTDPMPNGFARKGAEDEALRFMGSFFQRMSREHFAEASFRDATVIADVAVQLNREIEAPAARPV